MSDAAAVITTAMTILGGIVLAWVGHIFQMRRSKKDGVESEDVQTQPPLADPHEGWRAYVAGLKARAEYAEQELERERSLRWAAIHYCRRLLEWVTRKFPGAAPPPVPDRLSDYVSIPEDHHGSSQDRSRH